MKYIQLLFFLGIFACEKEKLPTTPTVINGTIVDENDMPFPNCNVEFYGEEFIGFRGGNAIPFYLVERSDENGIFSFSQIVPNETDEIVLRVLGVKDSIGFNRIPIGFKYAYFLNDQFISDRILAVDNENKIFGKTLNVKIKQIQE